jgi:hypothetical protein
MIVRQYNEQTVNDGYPAVGDWLDDAKLKQKTSSVVISMPGCLLATPYPLRRLAHAGGLFAERWNNWLPGRVVLLQLSLNEAARSGVGDRSVPKTLAIGVLMFLKRRVPNYDALSRYAGNVN